jgi:hypothetical protein
MTKPRIRRPVARINTDPQLGLLPDHDIPAPPATVASKPDRVRFIDNDPREIRVGANRLDEHLKLQRLGLVHSGERLILTRGDLLGVGGSTTTLKIIEL